MKIINKPLTKTADISSARGSAMKELRQLVLFTIVLLTVLYFSVGLLVDFIVSGISFESEAGLFKNFNISKALPKDPVENKKLEKAKVILKILTSGDSVPPLSYDLVLIKEKEPNAFAFPGGKIGLTTGLLDSLNDEIEMAFVLGHELGHFSNRDHLKGLGRGVGFGLAVAVVFKPEYGAKSFGNMANFVLQRTYSQDSEKKADRFGLELVYSKYGSIRGTDHLFKILQQKDKLPGWAYMFSTHPSPQKRILELQKFGKEIEKEDKNAQNNGQNSRVSY